MKREWAGVCCGVLYMQKRSVSHQQDKLTISPSTRVLTIHLPHWMLMSSLLRQQVSLRGRKVIWGVGWCGRSAFVCLGWRGVTALDLKRKKKWGWSKWGWGGGVQLHFLCRLKHAAATRSHSDVFLLIGTTSLCCCCFSPTHYFPLELVFLWTPLLGQMFCFQIILIVLGQLCVSSTGKTKQNTGTLKLNTSPFVFKL